MSRAYAPRGRLRPGCLDLRASDVVACEDGVCTVREAIHCDRAVRLGDLRRGLTAALLVVVPAGVAQAGPGPGDPPPTAAESVPPGAAEEARPAVAGPTEAPAEPPPTGKASSPAPVGDRWIRRYRPQRMTAEFGAAVGVLAPPIDHELYDYKQIWNLYKPAAASIVFRAGFYPLSFLGVEAEGGLAPTRTGDCGCASAVPDQRAILYGVRGQGVAQLPRYSVAPFVLVGGGVLGTTGWLGRDVDPALHFGGGLKIFASRWVGARLDARAHVGTAHSIDAYRTFYPEVLASVIVNLGRPYADTDGDGVADPGQRARVEDACPREAGPRSLRGCPDADGDGIKDGDDRCPRQSGLGAREGCPALVDSDADGYFDAGQHKIPEGLEDRCPGVIGVKEFSGCPAPDTDGDGLDDLADRCVGQPETVNGFEDTDGCPDKIPLDVKKILGTIQGIQFGFLSAQLTDPSKPILQRASAILLEYPDLKLEIQGHTDRDGDPEANRELSLRRAESVRRELIAGGIAEDRLTAVGYGSERPLDVGDTEAARAANRRIEFRLLDAEGRPLEVEQKDPP